MPRDLLRFATAGSVDDGKSTLIGRLLYDSKSLFSDQLDAVERVSRDRAIAPAIRCEHRLHGLDSAGRADDVDIPANGVQCGQ